LPWGPAVTIPWNCVKISLRLVEGTDIDLGNFQDRLSEFELAQWRLSQLAGQ
jgi:hypothetical protein